MRSEILALEAQASALEPNADARLAARNAVLAHTESFLGEIETMRAFIQTEDKGAAILDYPISEHGIGLDAAISLVDQYVDRAGLNPASGGHLGYIPGGGIYLSALGDYMADVSNRYAGVFFPNPGAVRMENLLVRWMADIIGYPETAAGALLSGGSIANLSCIVTARDAMGISSAKIPKATIYLTQQVHHCVTKAIRIAGLGECMIRYVRVDAHFRMDMEHLAELVEADAAQGLIPFMVVCSAGTTDCGAVDPIQEAAEICKRHHLWLHVDAAYGGFFILTEHGKKMIQGLAEADSIVMDPHKGLFLPYGTGAAIVKDGRLLAESHHYTATYLQDALHHQDEMSPADLSPELTKHFRGMRMWLPLQAHGLAPFKACLEEKLLLTRYFWEKLGEIKGMERGPLPRLSVTFFRYHHPKMEVDAFMQALIRAIHADGRVFLSSTSIDGHVYIRFACLAFRTHLRTVDLCLEMIMDCIRKVEAEYQMTNA